MVSVQYTYLVRRIHIAHSNYYIVGIAYQCCRLTILFCTVPTILNTVHIDDFEVSKLLPFQQVAIAQHYFIDIVVFDAPKQEARMQSGLESQSIPDYI
jgi:hypothetical protein